MNRAGRFLLCSLLAVASHSLATDYNKLSGYVKCLASYEEAQASLTRGRSATSERTLTAFLKADEAQTDELCKDYGLHQYTHLGDIAIVSIPFSSLGPLSEHPAVRRIEASPTGHLAMDTTAIIVGADKLYSPSFIQHQPYPFTGQGVILGIMDVGFDLTHPNFYDQTTTNYRIGAFWDQLSKDTIGSTLPVGRDFVGPDIVRAQAHSADAHIISHGTHTLGIAAGSGYQSPYQGIAYDADICVVNNAVNEDTLLIDSADIDKFTTAVDAMGFKYIFDYANRQGKPCVASFSEGYTINEPTADDSLYSEFLDGLVGPGRIIVAAAGNSGSSGPGVHAPGCFPSVICVGATAHRLGFTNYLGEYKEYANGRTIGMRSPYSCYGPAFNGLMKPDVLAPGDNIISSYSSFYLEANPNAKDINSDVEHFDFQGRTYAWNANTGTSMSTPVVAGVIALWLQAKPDLTREEIIDVFSHTSRTPVDTLTYPNYQYGYGEIDAYRGLLYLLGFDRIEAISPHQPQHPLFRQKGNSLCVEETVMEGTISIYNLAGQLLLRRSLIPGITIDLSTLPAGIYAVQTSTASTTTTGSTLIRL